MCGMICFTPASNAIWRIASKLSRSMPPVGSKLKPSAAQALATARNSSSCFRPPIGKNLKLVPPMSCNRAMAVSTGTSAAGFWLLFGPVARLTRPTLPVGETKPLITVSFWPKSARLVPTPVKTWLTCWGYKTCETRLTMAL